MQAGQRRPPPAVSGPGPELLGGRAGMAPGPGSGRQPPPWAHTGPGTKEPRASGCCSLSTDTASSLPWPFRGGFWVGDPDPHTAHRTDPGSGGMRPSPDESPRLVLGGVSRGHLIMGVLLRIPQPETPRPRERSSLRALTQPARPEPGCESIRLSCLLLLCDRHD